MTRFLRFAALLAATALALPVAAHNGVFHDPALPAQTKAEIHQVADAVQRYRDFGVAQREGWKKFGGDEPLMGEHWYNPRGLDLVGSDARLDFTRPTNLIYTDIGGKHVLTGVAFTVRIAPGERVPEGFYGDADHWHVHDFERAIEASLVDRPILRALANWWLDANYRSKGDNRGRVAMVHAWVTLPNPDGVFADANRTVPYLKLGLPASFADGASVDAARGLNLATPGGCNEAIDGRAWVANLPGRVIKGASRRLRPRGGGAAPAAGRSTRRAQRRRGDRLAAVRWAMGHTADARPACPHRHDHRARRARPRHARHASRSSRHEDERLTRCQAAALPQRAAAFATRAPSPRAVARSPAGGVTSGAALSDCVITPSDPPRRLILSAPAVVLAS